MLNTISWQGYWLSIALSLAGYYLTVYLLYFRSDFKISLPPRRKSPNADAFLQPRSEGVQETGIDFSHHPEFQKPDPGSDEHFVYALIDEVAAYFNEVKKGRVVKEELLFALQRIAAKYPAIKDSAYKESIGSVIISEANHHCSVQITSEEMGHVWLGS